MIKGLHDILWYLFITISSYIESCGRIFCVMGCKLMAAEQSTFMIDLQQVGMMLRYISVRYCYLEGLVLADFRIVFYCIN